jgi:hypothetical protein
MALVFFAVSRIPVSTDDSQEELVRRALAGSNWNADDNTTVTTYTTTASGSGDDIARLVRDALAGTAPAGGQGGGSIDAQLAQLTRLHESGALTAEEFAAAKKRLLGL